jgi:hypothetical protein
MKTEIDENLGNEKIEEKIEEELQYGDFEIIEEEEVAYPKRKFSNKLPMKVIESLGIPINDIRGITQLKTTEDLRIARLMIDGMIIEGPKLEENVDLFEILHYMPVIKAFLASSRAKSAIEKFKAKRSPMR